MAKPRDDQGAADSPNECEKTSIVDWPAAQDLDGASLSDLVRVGLASARRQGTADKRTWGQFLVERLLYLAGTGELRALQEIWTRLEGKPGTNDPAARQPPDIDDDLAEMILEYERKKSHSQRTPTASPGD